MRSFPRPVGVNVAGENTTPTCRRCNEALTGARNGATGSDSSSTTGCAAKAAARALVTSSQGGSVRVLESLAVVAGTGLGLILLAR